MTEAACTVDALGKACPVPVILLARAVAAVEVDEVVLVDADDAGAQADIPAWCRMKGHELVDVVEGEAAWRFAVRRRS